jgi:hypothetical protein
MTGQLIPPPGLDHPLPDNLSHEQLVKLWIDALEASDKMLLAGLAATLPPGADVREAYRRWYENYGREHYEMLLQMAQRFNQLQANHDSAGRAPDS